MIYRLYPLALTIIIVFVTNLVRNDFDFLQNILDPSMFSVSLIKRAGEFQASYLQCSSHFHTVSLRVLFGQLFPGQ